MEQHKILPRVGKTPTTPFTFCVINGNDSRLSAMIGLSGKIEGKALLIYIVVVSEKNKSYHLIVFSIETFALQDNIGYHTVFGDIIAHGNVDNA